MDLSSLLGTILSSDSVQNIGKTTQADSAAVKKVLTAALPSLLNGAKDQSADSATGFAEALMSHAEVDTSDLTSFLGKVDLEDGGKIVGHLLGKDSDAAIDKIARSAGVDTKSTAGIMSAAAPLLMSLLGKEASSGASEKSASAIGSVASLLLKNADFGDILSGLLGKDDDDKDDDKGGLGLLSILGKLLKK